MTLFTHVFTGNLLGAVECDHFELVQAVEEEVFVKAELGALQEDRRFVAADGLVLVDRVSGVALVDLHLLRHGRVDNSPRHVALKPAPCPVLLHSW